MVRRFLFTFIVCNPTISLWGMQQSTQQETPEARKARIKAAAEQGKALYAQKFSELHGNEDDFVFVAHETKNDQQDGSMLSRMISWAASQLGFKQ